MSRVIAFANPGGKSGKTSSAFGVASMLVDLGQQVLVVDLDPQAPLTRALGIDAETLSCSLFDVLVHGTSVVEAMLDTDLGLDIMPATLELSSIEASLVTRPGREHLLRHALAPIRDEYDWIVVDCASSMGLLTLNALATADLLIVPTRGHSPRALAQLQGMVAEVKAFVNPALDLAGALAVGTAYDPAVGLPLLAAIPQPPLALNAYREFAKTLARA